MKYINSKFNEFVKTLLIVEKLEIIFLDKDFLELYNELKIHDYCQHLALSRKTKLYELNKPLSEDNQTILFITDDYTLKLNSNKPEDISNTIQYFKNLKYINLALNNLDEVNDIIFLNLFNSIINIKNLECLNLDSTKLINFNHYKLNILANSISKIKTLTTLSLRNNYLNKIPPDKSESFLFLAKKSSNVENLNIANNILGSCSIEELNIISTFIKKFVNLKKLDLTCNNIGIINAKKLKILSKNLQKLTNLNTLILDNNNLNQMSLYSVRQFIKLITNINNLYCLSFFNCNLHLINSAYFDNIFIGLTQCTKLSHLTLGDIGKFNVINLSILVFYLARIQNLQILDLKNNQLDKLDELQTYILGRNISNCKNLICIDFSGNTINFEDILTDEIQKSNSIKKILGGQYNLKAHSFELSKKYLSNKAKPILSIFYNKQYQDKELSIAEFSDAIFLQKRISPIVTAILGTTGTAKNESLSFINMPLEIKYQIYSQLTSPQATNKEIDAAFAYINHVRKMK